MSPAVFPSPQIPTVFLMSLLDALEAGYGKYKNPYHNQIHAADVTQTVHCFLLRSSMVVSVGWGISASQGRVGQGSVLPDGL